MLAEFFKSQGLDGIEYRSSVGPKSNIIFFDLDVAEVVACGLFQMNGVKYNSIEASKSLLHPEAFAIILSG